MLGAVLATCGSEAGPSLFPRAALAVLTGQLDLPPCNAAEGPSLRPSAPEQKPTRRYHCTPQLCLAPWNSLATTHSRRGNKNKTKQNKIQKIKCKNLSLLTIQPFCVAGRPGQGFCQGCNCSVSASPRIRGAVQAQIPSPRCSPLTQITADGRSKQVCRLGARHSVCLRRKRSQEVDLFSSHSYTVKPLSCSLPSVPPRVVDPLGLLLGEHQLSVQPSSARCLSAGSFSCLGSLGSIKRVSDKEFSRPSLWEGLSIASPP